VQQLQQPVVPGTAGDSVMRSAPTSSVSASRDSGSRAADISDRPSPAPLPLTRSGVVKYQTFVLLADWLLRTSAPTVSHPPGRASSSHR
jgi:hypothetical protein